MPMKTLMQIQREITLAEDCSGKGPTEAWGLCATTLVTIEGKHCPGCDTDMPTLADDPVGNCLSCGQTCTPIKGDESKMKLIDIGMYNLPTAKILSLFAKHYEASGMDNPEAALVGLSLLTKDQWALEAMENADHLKTFVLEYAMDEDSGGQYAGLIYVPGEFLDSDDEYYEATDEGLSMVPFEDLYKLLCAICAEIGEMPC